MASTKGTSLPKASRMKVTFTIPTVLALFTLASGFLAYSLTKQLTKIPAGESLPIFAAVFALAGLAFVTGLILAFAVINPIRKMTKIGEEILPSLKETPEDKSDEISYLTGIVDRIGISLNQLIKDHQVLQNLTQGLITIDPAGTMISLNKVAERFLGSGFRGRHYKELLPIHDGNKSFLDRVETVLEGKESPLSKEERLQNFSNEDFTMWISVLAIQEPKGVLISLKSLD